MATPVQITVKLTSYLGVPVMVTIDGTNQIDSSGNVQTNDNFTAWASPTQGSSSTICQSGAISWNNVTPGQPAKWSGWLMDPNAITPNDPTGSSARTEIFLMPDVELSSDGFAAFKPDAAASHNLVDCGGVTPGPEIAVDVSLALSRGCTAYTGS